MMAERNTKFRAVAVLVVFAVLGITIWYKFYRVVSQPAWITAISVMFSLRIGGADQVSGLPYWIWLALPRMFPEYMPAPGGYSALGLSWEEGREMPVGLAKQRIGYVRVTGNCALCHAVSQRTGTDEVPAIIPAVAGHATDIRPLVAFYRRCAQDPRFNADDILSEVETGRPSSRSPIDCSTDIS